MKTLLPVMPFTVIGDPDLKTSLEIVRTFAESGAHSIELGFPFSDPAADGPTIQAADTRALNAGVTTSNVLTFLKNCRTFTDKPIGLLSYYNPILQYGVERFYKEAARAGLTSLLIADLPLEESKESLIYAKRYGINPIFIVSALTSPQRLKQILLHASGFLYVVSKPGITGIQKTIDPETLATLRHLKKQTSLPLHVGFGISTSEHVKAVLKAGADCAIVGSALVKTIENNLKTPSKMLKTIQSQMQALTHP